MTCNYCGRDAEFRSDSLSVYRKDYGPIWICEPCGAFCGCHPDGKPLGRLANAELRYWRKRAHSMFDPLWKAKIERTGKKKKHARGSGYNWLSKQMELEPGECHIGMFDVEQCKRVVGICEPYFKQSKA